MDNNVQPVVSTQGHSCSQTPPNHAREECKNTVWEALTRSPVHGNLQRQRVQSCVAAILALQTKAWTSSKKSIPPLKDSFYF